MIHLWCRKKVVVRKFLYLGLRSCLGGCLRFIPREGKSMEKNLVGMRDYHKYQDNRKSGIFHCPVRDEIFSAAVICAWQPVSSGWDPEFFYGCAGGWE